MDFIHQYNEITIKLAELKKSLSKYLPAERVRNNLSWVCANCMSMGDYRPLDKALAVASEQAKTTEAVESLKAS